MIELELEDPSLTVGEEFSLTRLLHRKRKALNLEKMRSYRKRKIASGICAKCTWKAKPGFKHCSRCLERDRVTGKEWRSRGWRRREWKR